MLLCVRIILLFALANVLKNEYSVDAWAENDVFIPHRNINTGRRGYPWFKKYDWQPKKAATAEWPTSTSTTTRYTPSTTEQPKKTTNKEKLLTYFNDITGSKTLSGVYVQSTATNSNKSCQTVHKISGAFPAIISKEMPLYSANLVEWSSFTDEVISNWNKGYLVSIVWFRGSPLKNMKIFTDKQNAAESEKRWNDLIQDDGHLNKVWEKQLRSIAPFLQQIQSAGVVPIFDILPYINYKEYIWRGRPGVNGTAKLYQISHDYLTKQHNLTSLIWSWSLYGSAMTQLEEFWPGKEYVDVASVYMWGKKELTIPEYHRLVSVVGDKPLSMDEINTVPTPELLSVQHRWTWFTATDHSLESKSINDNAKVKTTFNSMYVVNKGKVDFFNSKN